jgi:hypothetical protein
MVILILEKPNPKSARPHSLPDPSLRAENQLRQGKFHIPRLIGFALPKSAFSPANCLNP